MSEEVATPFIEREAELLIAPTAIAAATTSISINTLPCYPPRHAATSSPATRLQCSPLSISHNHHNKTSQPQPATMKATITTLLLALAPALPIISAVAIRSPQNLPFNHFCQGISIQNNTVLFADTCNRFSSVQVDLNACIANTGGHLGYVTDEGDGNFGNSCGDCRINDESAAIMECTCSPGGGLANVFPSIDLKNSTFIWFDNVLGKLGCENLNPPPRLPLVGNPSIKISP
ncbi:hypothetical protein F4821DRAFT_249496 [Hypoxylon rubiginosum]|uniref:Uncharacterized protein n=1 Tax=Hypoxylon rubiginosum TaxID=110542 RepID=A0ACC0CLX9_9PEZI|nr:hypothetical protein F4821DRAFT_249496 [Hypoxylon rubiginosum]